MFKLEHAAKTHRESRGTALFFNFRTRWEWSTPRPVGFTPGNDPVPILYEAGWAPRQLHVL
jgi:hypothetical protein